MCVDPELNVLLNENGKRVYVWSQCMRRSSDIYTYSHIGFWTMNALIEISIFFLVASLYILNQWGCDQPDPIS